VGSEGRRKDSFRSNDILKKSQTWQACPSKYVCIGPSQNIHSDSKTFKKQYGLYNSIQFFIIYVPSQQPQGQLQAQHSLKVKKK
jgi:hypothetical protein